jgi:ribonuclease D
LVDLLQDGRQLKVGLSLRDDIQNLKRKHEFEPRGFLDLQHYVKEMGVEAQSLQKIYALLFGKKISKSQRLTNWEADVLTDRQKGYAATDAWACIQLLKEISHLDANGYMLDIIPEPEQMPPPLLSQDEQRERKERKEKKKRASRQRKLHDKDNSKRRKRVRKDKEIVKSLDAYESKSHNQNIL